MNFPYVRSRHCNASDGKYEPVNIFHILASFVAFVIRPSKKKTRLSDVVVSWVPLSSQTRSAGRYWDLRKHLSLRDLLWVIKRNAMFGRGGFHLYPLRRVHRQIWQLQVLELRTWRRRWRKTENTLWDGGIFMHSLYYFKHAHERSTSICMYCSYYIFHVLLPRWFIVRQGFPLAFPFISLSHWQLFSWGILTWRYVIWMPCGQHWF